MMTPTARVVFAICLVAIGHGSVRAEPVEQPASPTIINVKLGHQGNAKSAAIWVSNGTYFDQLSAVADVVKDSGHPKICLYVDADYDDLHPDNANGDQHVGVRLESDHAEVFVCDEVPFSLTEMLCQALSQLKGIQEVKLRHLGRVQIAQETLTPANDWDKDPFTSTAMDLDASQPDDTNPFEK